MMTAEQYRESLRDGRQMYVNGAQIDDVVTHPRFKTAVERSAQDYDRHYDPTPAPAGRTS